MSFFHVQSFNVYTSWKATFAFKGKYNNLISYKFGIKHPKNIMRFIIFIFQDVTKELCHALNSALPIYLTWYISWSTRRTIHQLSLTVESNKGEQNADILN